MLDDRVSLQGRAGHANILFCTYTCVRKRRYHPIAHAARVTAAVVKMQDDIDDDVAIFRATTREMQVVEEWAGV